MVESESAHIGTLLSLVCRIRTCRSPQHASIVRTLTVFSSRVRPWVNRWKFETERDKVSATRTSAKFSKKNHSKIEVGRGYSRVLALKLASASSCTL